MQMFEVPFLCIYFILALGSSWPGVFILNWEATFTECPFHVSKHFFIKLKRQKIQKQFVVRLSVADQDPVCNFDADPDPWFQIKAQNLKKCLNRPISIYFGL